MLERARKLAVAAFGARSISVESESPSRLVLRCGGLETVFDRTEGKVTQNGKLAAVLALVEEVQLHRPRGQEGAQNWFVTVLVKGHRSVEVGQVTEDAQASIIGARIATITGRPAKMSA
jgi:hypothetical protein